MNTSLEAAMEEAARLTHNGRLVRATELIQQPLAGAAPTGIPVTARARPVAAERLRRLGSDLTGQLGALPGRAAWSVDVGPLPQARPASSPACRLDTFSYRNTAGSRSYGLYVPGAGTDRALPLLVMLHGGTQDADMFATATGMNELAERDGLLVAYPQQTRAANQGQYWNWFDPAHQRRGAGEPSLIAGITREVIDRYDVDSARVYVAGFSAGGAMAAVMATTYPDLYCAVGVHSGLAYGSATNVTSAFAAMNHGRTDPAKHVAKPVPLIVFHGGRDTTVVPTNAEHLVDDALAAAANSTQAVLRAGAVTTRGRVSGGHTYTRVCYPDSSGLVRAEHWTVHEAGHSWSGGVPNGSYTDPRGPNASAEFTRFFLDHPARP